MKKLAAYTATIAISLSAIGLASPAFAADRQVSVFSFPGLTEGDQTCSDEVDNLEEIILNIPGYGVDRTITSLADSGGTTLLSKLNASEFFFVPDMERAFTVSDTSDFPDTAVTAFQTWLNAGGVLVMTGTAGTKDVDFLNKITDWGLASASGLNGATRVDANAAGTPFAGTDLNVSLTTPSATDAISVGTAPDSANFKAMWGTSTQAAVATMTYGYGTIIYLGWDFYNSGFDESTPAVACGENSDDWVQLIVPAALEYAVTLSSAPAPVAAAPAPYSGPLPTGVSNSKPAAGQELTINGKRLDGVTRVTIDGMQVEIIEGLRNSCKILLPSSLTPGVKDILLFSGNGTLTYLEANEVIAPIEASTGVETPAELTRVNAASFKGYVVIYALNLEGRRLSAQVGKDWTIVEEIPAANNNLYQHVEYTGVGYEIRVKIFIDRKLEKTVDLTTR